MRICAAGRRLVAGLLGGLICSSATLASYTPIFPPNGEETHGAILSYIYGGSFTPTGEQNLSFTNGTITAVRVEDTLEAPGTKASRVINGGGDDQLWLADYTIASARAKYAVFPQEFGYFLGSSGGSYVKLFDQTGWGYNVGGSVDLSFLAGELLRWGRAGENRTWSSDPETNPDGLDHMVTYRIERSVVERGVPQGLTTWLLFWEDKYPLPPTNPSRSYEQDADFDFNDLVVELQAFANINVPEPATAAVAAGLGLAAVARRRRQA